MLKIHNIKVNNMKFFLLQSFRKNTPLELISLKKDHHHPQEINPKLLVVSVHNYQINISVIFIRYANYIKNQSKTEEENKKRSTKQRNNLD